MSKPKLEVSSSMAATSVFEVFNHDLNTLIGQILTIVDAVIPEGQQNKCTKDLIKEKINDVQKMEWEQVVRWEQNGLFNKDYQLSN